MDKNCKSKIHGIWFENYPGLDDWPEDPYDAWSGVGVDAGMLGEFWFFVTTIKPLEKDIKDEKGSFQFGRNILIVEKFDLELINEAIESVLHMDIEEYGQNIT